MVLATMFVSLPFVVREVIPVLREIGDEQEQAAATLGAARVADVLADHAAGDPLGRRLRRRPDDGAGARRVRRGQRRLGPDLGPDRDAAALRASQKQFENFDPAGAYAAAMVLALLALVTSPADEPVQAEGGPS